MMILLLWTQRHDADGQSWTERARRMAEYVGEARRFMERASQHFPVNPEDVRVLVRLWVESDELDALVLPLLGQMNADLMDDCGELETSRSVTTRTSPFGAFDESAAQEVVYECIWSLAVESGPSVNIHFSVNGEGMFEAQAVGSSSGVSQRIGYPITEERLKDALVAVYVAEVSSD